MRADLQTIYDWIPNNSRVLDLGCGSGELLHQLKTNKNCNSLGIEINDENILKCVEQNINVIQQDLNQGLKLIADNSFDWVILSQTITAVLETESILLEMNRVAKKGCMISFPNFGYWRYILSLAQGHMPSSEDLPYEWYDTPNVHWCTIKDFIKLMKKHHFHIQKTQCFNGRLSNKSSSLLLKINPNLFANMAVISFGKINTKN